MATYTKVCGKTVINMVVEDMCGIMGLYFRGIFGMIREKEKGLLCIRMGRRFRAIGEMMLGIRSLGFISIMELYRAEIPDCENHDFY